LMIGGTLSERAAGGSAEKEREPGKSGKGGGSCLYCMAERKRCV